MRNTATETADAELAEFVGQFYADPLGFVRSCFPWGEPGSLKDQSGPDVWQVEFLTWLGKEVKKRKFDGVKAVKPIRGAVSSGHGIGKSTLQAWIVCWVLSTRPNCKGTVTANTSSQLDTKTWAAIQHWMKLCITSHWFEVNSTRVYRRGERESWFCSPQSCKEENSEAFAGQHAADSTSLYDFDESSAISDKIFEVAEGGLTDGEPMIFLFGNPTKATGQFHKVCFGTLRDRWHVMVVDSRSSRFTNKAEIAEWEQDYGEDSDFFRIRVKGLPPAAGDLQYIDSATVLAAQRRKPDGVLSDEPLVCGLDVARGGMDSCVFWFRRGIDAASIPPMRIPGEQARDSMRLVSVAADLLTRTFNNQKIAMLFIDGTGIGGPIVDRLKQLGHENVLEVQFGAHAPNPKYANMRSYIWGQMRDWLKRGCIGETTREIEQDLTGPSYFHDKRDRLILEAKEHMKARGLASPDLADALALTFSAPIIARETYTPAESGGSWQSV